MKKLKFLTLIIALIIGQSGFAKSVSCVRTTQNSTGWICSFSEVDCPVKPYIAANNFCVNYFRSNKLPTINVFQDGNAVLEDNDKIIKIASDKAVTFFSKNTEHTQKEIDAFFKTDDGIVSKKRLDAIAKELNATIIKSSAPITANYCPACDEETKKNQIQGCPGGYEMKDGWCQKIVYPTPDKVTQSPTTGTKSIECPKGSYEKNGECIPWPIKESAAMIYLGSTGSFGIGKTKSEFHVPNLGGIQADIYVPFVRKGIITFGINVIGNYTLSSKNPFSKVSIEPFRIINETSTTVATTTSSSQKNQAFQFAVGPQLNIHIGKHFVVSPIFNVGYMNLSQNDFSAIQTSQVNGITYNLNLLTQSQTSVSSLLLAPKLRLHYFINDWIGLWIDGAFNYSNSLKSTITKFTPSTGPDANGLYDESAIIEGTESTETIKSSFNAVGISGGLVFAIGSRKPKNNPIVERGTQPNGQDDGNPFPPIKKPQTVIENTKPDQGDYTLSWRIEKKQDEQKNDNCINIQSPKNGSNQNINEAIKISVKIDGSKVQGEPTITIYKISNDKNYWNKNENLNQLLNTNDFMMMSMQYEKEAKETGFTPITVKAKQRGSQLESIIDKGKLSEGAYKIVANTNCGVSSSNFTATTTDITITDFTITCGANYGSYNFSIKVADFATANIIAQNLTLTALTSGGSISGVTFAGLPTTITHSSSTSPINITITGSFNYSGSYPGNIKAKVEGYDVGHVGDTNYLSIDNQITDIKPCICNYCEKDVEFDYNQATAPTYNATNNSIHISQDLWDMAGKPLVGVKAEIIGFERTISDECMKCDKNGNQWGNFIGGNSGSTAGSFSTANDGGVTGNTHHSIYFYPSNSYKYDMDIAIPPLSKLSCCCDKMKIKIRYTHIFKDANGECKMCSNVFEYEFTHGTCTPTPTDGGGPWHPSGGVFEAVPLDLKNTIKN